MFGGGGGSINFLFLPFMLQPTALHSLLRPYRETVCDSDAHMQKRTGFKQCNDGITDAVQLSIHCSYKIRQISSIIDTLIQGIPVYSVYLGKILISNNSARI